jgi:hypothetical protein
MVSGLVIVLCSTLFHHGLYQVLRLGLVRRVCEPLVRRRTGRKDLTFSEGDVSHTAELLVSFTNGVVGSICSIVVVWQAREDVMLSRAPLLIPCTHWIAQYMLYDNYAMYNSAYYRKDIRTYPHLTTRLAVFARKKWSMILHHVLLLGFGYALVVYPWIRNNKGDFIIGAFFLREVWNPFQNMAQILKQFQMQETTLYFLNGMSLVLVQLVARVLNWPLVIIIYTAQYHNWDFIASFNSLYTVCIVSTGMWQILEFHWFWMIVQLVAGFKNGKKESKTH